MPGFNVKVEDGKEGWNLTIGGESKITDETSGKIKSADIKALDPASYVVITKQVNGETRYYKKDAGTALAPVSNVGLDRFVSVNDLANIVFDDNGYVIDTEYYEWKFDKNADGDLTNDGTGTNGFAKKGGSAYLTQDSTANGKALDVEDFGDVYTVHRQEHGRYQDRWQDLHHAWQGCDDP